MNKHIRVLVISLYLYYRLGKLPVKHVKTENKKVWNFFHTLYDERGMRTSNPHTIFPGSRFPH